MKRITVFIIAVILIPAVRLPLFSQDRSDYVRSCSAALKKDIVVNTIFCGNYREGISPAGSTARRWEAARRPAARCRRTEGEDCPCYKKYQIFR